MCDFGCCSWVCCKLLDLVVVLTWGFWFGVFGILTLVLVV